MQRNLLLRLNEKIALFVLTAAFSIIGFSLIALQEHLVSNIVSVIHTSYQRINQTDGAKSFLNVHYFNY